MKQEDKDSDDTFSDLLTIIALMVAVPMVSIAGWYFSNGQHDYQTQAHLRLNNIPDSDAFLPCCWALGALAFA